MILEFRILASGSKGNAYILSNDTAKILIECGIAWKQLQKKMNFKTHEINFTLVTHRHADHAGYIKDALAAGIDTYTSQDVINYCDTESRHRLHEIKHKKTVKIGLYTILPLSVPHDVPNLCFIILRGKEKWLYITDCIYCPYHFSGLTGIAIGINYDMDLLKENVKNDVTNSALANRILSSHMSLQTALDFFRAQDLNKVREIHVLHCSETNIDKEKAKREIQKVTGKLISC